MLVEVPGLHPLTPVIALEHHRHAAGGGYPDIGDARPHPLSRLVSVADVYEAVTGARAYRPPSLPEQACLVLARLAGTQLDGALVKAFVNAVTFFPLGTLVRTSREEIGVVVRATERDPLHPVIQLVEEGDPARPLPEEIDLSRARRHWRVPPSRRTRPLASSPHAGDVERRSGPAHGLTCRETEAHGGGS